MLRVHHLNCGTFCPFGGHLFDGISHGLFGRLVCHCLLIESDAGLVLIDTGLGTQDVRHPYPRLSPLYVRALLNIKLREEDTAVAQIRKLGFSPADVRHIVMTHLDFDHAGGLEDFPQATVHVLAEELEAATKGRHGFVGTRRYRPGQFDEVKAWRTYDGRGEPWFGFEAVRDLQGLPPEILLVPLCGHTRGHAGVAIHSDRGWMLHAGDAYFYREEIGRPDRRCTPGLEAYQTLMEIDRKARFANQQRIRTLSLERKGEVDIFCAHDPVELSSRLTTAAGAP